MGDLRGVGGHRHNGSGDQLPARDGYQSPITRSGNVPERWADQLTACFGTDEWRTIAYSREVDLFGNEVTTKNGDVAEMLLELYVSRLKSLFPFVAKPHLIRNTRNAPLYYLIWAGPNKLGLKGADYILRQGERVGKR